MTDPAALLRDLFAAAVAAADPMRVIPDRLPPRPSGRVLVIGAGKASARMAEAVESVWGPCDGLVITRYGYERPTRGMEIVSAAHPVPDEAGVAATERMLTLLSGLGPDDFVLALISGGASALLVAPAPGVALAEKQAATSALLSSGAPISDINRLRCHLSRVKGGQLAAAAHPARMLALLVSDVPGDDPALIGSGPTVGALPADTAAIATRWGLDLPRSVQAALARSSPVVPPDDPRLATTETRIIAAASQSLTAAADLARMRLPGLRVENLGDAIEGEARAVAADHAARALDIRAALRPGGAPVLILSGGELTVTIKGDGVGGPNAEYALALAQALDGTPGIHAIACDTDGVDGAAEVAGAVIGPDTLARARASGIDPAAALDRNDAHGFFAALGDQVAPGPTLTNVNDFRAILILPPG